MALILRNRFLYRHLQYVSRMPKTREVIPKNFSTLCCKNQPGILISCFPRYIFKRTIFKFLRRPPAKKYKERDNVPDHFILIYKNGMDRYIYAAHMVVFITAVFVCLVVLIKNDIYKSEIKFTDWKETPRTTENEVVIYITAVLLIAVLVHYMVTKIPLRIYKVPKQKKYVFVFNGGIPLTTRNLKSEIGQIRYVGKEGVLPWKQHLYEVNDEYTIIMLENFFHRPADLYIMLGEQRDPELEDS